MSQPASKAIEETLLIENLPYEIDAGIASRASIGLIVLATDYTIEHEWRQVFNGTERPPPPRAKSIPLAGRS